MSSNSKRTPFTGRNVALALVWTVFSRGFKASGVSDPLSSLSVLKSLHTSPLHCHTSGAPPYHHVVCPALHHLCVRSCLVCCMWGRDTQAFIFSAMFAEELPWSELLDSWMVMQCFILLGPPWVGRTRLHMGMAKKAATQRLEPVEPAAGLDQAAPCLSFGASVTDHWALLGQQTFIMRISPIPGDGLSSATYMGMETCYNVGSNPGSCAQHYWCSVAYKWHNSLIQEVVFEAIFMKTRQQFLSHLLWPRPTQSSQKIVCLSQRWISLTAKCCKMVCFWLCHSYFIQHFGRNMNSTRPVLTFS